MNRHLVLFLDAYNDLGSVESAEYEEPMSIAMMFSFEDKVRSKSAQLPQSLV